MKILVDTRLKSLEQPFVHLHLLIGDDHHIIEINDCQWIPWNIYLSSNLISNGIYNNNNIYYRFQADWVGFFPASDYEKDLHPDMKQSGNVRSCLYEYSTLVIRTIDSAEGRIINIRSTFNQKLVETSLVLRCRQDMVDSMIILKSIRDAINLAWNQWLGICNSCIFYYPNVQTFEYSEK